MMSNQTSHIDESKFVFVDEKYKIEIAKMLEDLEKFNQFIPELSNNFEANLILLERHIHSISDLQRALKAKRVLTKSIQGFYDLSDAGITLEEIERVHLDSTLLVDHLYWKNYKIFSDNVIERYRMMQQFKDDEMKQNEIRLNLVNLFFPLKETEDQITKQMKQLSLYFHADKVPSEYVKIATEMFFLISELKELLLLNLMSPSLSPDLKIIELELLAREAHELSVHFNRALRLQQRKLDPSIDITPDLLLLSQQPETELVDNRKIHATRACSYYRSIIKIVDRMAKTDASYIVSQIKYRDAIAASFHLAGFRIEAQIYLVSAIFLAADIPDASERIMKLNRRLNEIAGKATSHHFPTSSNPRPSSQSPPSTQTPTFNEMSNALVIVARNTPHQLVSEAQRKALKKELKTATQNFLIENTVRPDMRLTEYHAPSDYISQARNTAMIYTTSGVLCFVGGTISVVPIAAFTVSACAAEGVALPAAVAAFAVAGPVGLTLAGICMVGGIYFGYSLFNSGLDKAKKPKRQQLLNEIMTKAMKCYESGNYVEMFKNLSQKYLDKNLMTFTEGVDISINAKEIIDELLDHGFRCDGIGLILHIIAEGLICCDLKLQEPHGRDWLRQQALEVIFALETSETLDNDAKRLDELIFQSKSRIFQQTSQTFSIHSRGIPASYIKDAKYAPFKSRLGEIRTIASINKVILYILNNENKWAIDNVIKIKKVINDNFQYFTVSIFRIEALEDFLAAKGLLDEDNDESLSSIPLKSIVDVPTNSKLVWGNNEIDCINETTLPGGRRLPWYQLLSMLPNCLLEFQSSRELITLLQAKLDQEEKRFEDELALSQGNAIFPYDVISSLQRFINLLNDDDDQVEVPLSSRMIEDLKEIFNIQLIICHQMDGTNHQLKYLYKLSNQEGNHSTTTSSYGNTTINWEKTYFITEDLSMVFQASNDDNTKRLIAFQAATALEQAREFLEEGRRIRSSNNIMKSIKSYQEAIKFFLKALYCFDSQWKYGLSISSTLYQFREYQNLIQFTKKFRNDMIHFPQQRQWSKEEMDTILSLMECYCNIFQFSKVLDLVVICIQREEMKQHPLFWYWYAIAARKSIYHFDAIFAIQHALELNALSYERIRQEHRIITRLNEKEITGKVQDYINTYIQYDRHHHRHHRYHHHHEEPRNKRKFYDIISIDGGGIKGLLPAYWLAEIEKRSHSSISDLVQMLAGTSTGAVIAGALSIPNRSNSNSNATTTSTSSLLPLAARDLVELYSDPTQLCDVFCSQFSLGGVLGPKYNDNRKKVFHKFVGDIKLASTKIDVVIPAVNEHYPAQTTYFSNFQAKKNHHENYFLIDTLMASSAAPTYFPSYKINGESYVDGGMQVNNPSKVAYDLAMKNQSDPIRIWSLGTGNYVSLNDSFNSRRNAFYWACNAYEVAVANQQSEIDNELSPILGDRYHRWQVWFHQPIALDNYQENDLKYLIEYARQFIEEADASDENPINKCVEAFLSNQGK